MMGFRLARELEALAMADDPRMKGMTPQARLCLYVMALNAHDDGTKTLPRACYFRGWEHLAGQQGYPDQGPTAKRATMRALGELTDRHLIEQVGRRGSGRGKRVYRLHLWKVTDTSPWNGVL